MLASQRVHNIGEPWQKLCTHLIPDHFHCNPNCQNRPLQQPSGIHAKNHFGLHMQSAQMLLMVLLYSLYAARRRYTIYLFCFSLGCVIEKTNLGANVCVSTCMLPSLLDLMNPFSSPGTKLILAFCSPISHFAWCCSRVPRQREPSAFILGRHAKISYNLVRQSCFLPTKLQLTCDFDNDIQKHPGHQWQGPLDVDFFEQLAYGQNGLRNVAGGLI